MYGTCGRIDNKADFDFDNDRGMISLESVLERFFLQLLNNRNIDSQSESTRISRAWAFKVADDNFSICCTLSSVDVDTNIVIIIITIFGVKSLYSGQEQPP